ncbi:hypothetical protein H5410_051042 [Solanum commersonii]|uniref:Uncharacterized protein n=1 Tax=Solanum commersonii TaxID=4109 RepID=A0A9J5WYG9_SOLCO|nr:hypothetical protein H5410_051042 [Solanum commersonii]
MHSASNRMALTWPKVPMCRALMKKINTVIKRSSRRVAELFCEVVLYRPMIQKKKMLKAKALKISMLGHLASWVELAEPLSGFPNVPISTLISSFI